MVHLSRHHLTSKFSCERRTRYISARFISARFISAHFISAHFSVTAYHSCHTAKKGKCSLPVVNSYIGSSASPALQLISFSRNGHGLGAYVPTSKPSRPCLFARLSTEYVDVAQVVDGPAPTAVTNSALPQQPLGPVAASQSGCIGTMRSTPQKREAGRELGRLESRTRYLPFR